MKKGGRDEKMNVRQRDSNPAPSALALKLDAIPIELSRTLHCKAIYGNFISFLPLSLPYLLAYLVVGGSLKIKMADGGIPRTTFIVKHDGSIDFLINRKTAVQELRFFHVRILTP